MECRSEERRQYIVDNYNMVPVAHIQLLNGQTKHSDAGQTIENDYYIFEATSKVNGKKEIIQCGMTAARDFLKKINHEGLPCLILCMEREEQGRKAARPLEVMNPRK